MAGWTSDMGGVYYWSRLLGFMLSKLKNIDLELLLFVFLY
jgi:hypothetical protein